MKPFFTLVVRKAMKTMFLTAMLLIGMMGIYVAIELNSYGLFATSAIMVSVIFMHDIFHRNVRK